MTLPRFSGLVRIEKGFGGVASDDRWMVGERKKLEEGCPHSNFSGGLVLWSYSGVARANLIRSGQEVLDLVFGGDLL